MHNLWNQIQSLYKNHDEEKALELCQQLLILEPGHLGALEILAIASSEKQNYAESIDYFQQLLQLVNPPPANLLYNLGLTYYYASQYAEALSYLEAALHKELPLHSAVQAWYILGQIYHKKENYKNAATAWKNVLSLNHSHLDTLFQLALLYQQHLKDFNLASQYARLCVQNITESTPANFCHELGNLLRTLEENDLAEKLYLCVLQKEPKNLDTLLNLGYIYHCQHHPVKALEVYNKARITAPADTRFNANHSQTLLLSGDLAKGFAAYESRKKAPSFASSFAWFQRWSEWNGENFSGKSLLVYSEQGLGDMLQFSRFLPQVKARGGSVYLSVKKPLLPLLKDLTSLDHVVEHAEEPLSALSFDLVVPIMTLPFIFGTTLRSIPSNFPYLQTPSNYQKKWQLLLPPQKKALRVGLVWAGNPEHTEGLIRTAGLQAFAPLAACTHIEWVSLQKGEAAQEAANSSFSILDLTDQIHDFADTAALIEQLDLVISIDTSVPHLAGSLGKPVWVLLPSAGEWRWLIGRSNTPWYPTMRLFRQPKPRDWNTPMLQVLEELQRLE